MKGNKRIPFSDLVLDRFAAATIPHLIEFYSNPENQKAYEQWLKEKKEKECKANENQ